MAALPALDTYGLAGTATKPRAAPRPQARDRWSSLVVECRSSARRRDEVLGSAAARKATVDRLVAGLRGAGKDEAWMERYAMLEFLQEYAVELLEQEGDALRHAVLGTLHSLLVDLPCGSAQRVEFIGSVMVATTTVSILLELPVTDKHRVLEFVHYLFEVLSGAVESLDSSTGGSATTAESTAPREVATSRRSSLATSGGGSLQTHTLPSSGSGSLFAEGQLARSVSALGKDLERGIAEVAARTGFNWGGAASRASERILRGTAAECLRELEHAYPGMLAHTTEAILDLTEKEGTHVVQSYESLYSTVLYHNCIYTVQQFYNNFLQSDEYASDSSDVDDTNAGDITLEVVIDTEDAGVGMYTSSSRSAASKGGRRARQKAVLPSSLFPLPQDTSMTSLSPLMGSHLYSQLHVLPRMIVAHERTCGSGEHCSASAHVSLYFPERLQKELRKSVSHIIDALPYCSRWAIVEMVSKLVNLVSLCGLPADLFAEHFQRLRHTFSTELLHVLLRLSIEYPSVFGGYHDQLVEAAVVVVNDASQSEEVRLLITQWLIELFSDKTIPHETTPSTESCVAYSPAIFASLQPSVLDPFCLRAAKARAQVLFRCRGTALVGVTSQERMEGNSLASKRLYGPTDALASMESFRYHAARTREVDAVFELLTVLVGDLHANPQRVGAAEEHDKANNLVLCTLVECPHLLEHIISLISSPQLPDTARQSLQDMVLHQLLLMPLPGLSLYLPMLCHLIHIGATEDMVTAVLRRVHQMVVTTDLCERGEWHIGDLLLELCRAVMLLGSTIPRTRWFCALECLLHNLADEFSDLEIRERSLFYSRLLSHAGADTVAAIVGTSALAEADSQLSSPGETLASRNLSKGLFLENAPLSLNLALRRDSFAVAALPSASGVPREVEDDSLGLVTESFTVVKALQLKVKEDTGAVAALSMHFLATSHRDVVGSLPVLYVPLLPPVGGVVDLELPLDVVAPFPTVLEVEARYSRPGSEEDYRCRLPSLTLKLEDYFMPLCSDNPAALFLQSHEKLARLVGESADGAIVVASQKSIAVERSSALELLRTEMGVFVTSLRETDDDATVVHVGCRLPPSYILLFTFTVSSDSTAVQLMTDCWPLLRFVDKFLEDLLLPPQLG